MSVVLALGAAVAWGVTDQLRAVLWRRTAMTLGFHRARVGIVAAVGAVSGADERALAGDGRAGKRHAAAGGGADR